MRLDTLVISGSPGGVCRICAPACLPHHPHERRQLKMNECYFSLTCIASMPRFAKLVNNQAGKGRISPESCQAFASGSKPDAT